LGLVRAWRRSPLWLRLISAMLALAALGLTLTGAFGVRLLRGYLVDRVDEQLAAAGNELERGAGQIVMSGPQQVAIPSQFHVVVADPRGRTAGVLPSMLADSEPELPGLTIDDATDRAGEPFTVDATQGSGSWRAISYPFSDGSGSVTIAVSMTDVDDTVQRLVQIDLLVGLAVLCGLAIVGYSMVRTALRPLVEIEVTAAAIGRGDLTRRVPDHHPRTEMGRLGRALNAMLEQVESSFQARSASEARARRSEQRMRRFVADASHELRTPLTSIRGFAELHRQGAVTDPDEVSRLLVRIEDEATRMGLLVDDLLLLARLDQPRPLQFAAVDVAGVAAAAVESARVAAPDREITLAVEGSPAPVVVVGDEPRLHQVIANLLDNACAYSPPGAPVSVRLGTLRRDGRDLVSVEVVDRGQGLSPDQAERVFERFYRTDAARGRARGGTGLGLSIVAAIAAAHGGAVEVDSAVGEGSTFRVLLPRQPVDDGRDDDGPEGGTPTEGGPTQDGPVDGAVREPGLVDWRA
jgi:two-component system OmpR family sensor kinase